MKYEIIWLHANLFDIGDFPKIQLRKVTTEKIRKQMSPISIEVQI